MDSIFQISSYREDHFTHKEDNPSEQKEVEELHIPENSDSLHSEGNTLALLEDTLTYLDNTDSLTISLTDSTPEVFDTIAPYSSARYFEELIANYQSKTLSRLPPNTSRTDLIVRYYRHDGDSDKVKSLADYGFYLHERPVTDDAGWQESNALFYGDSVRSEDIQLIAYILMQNGVSICQIKPSKFHDSWKSRAVEIGVCSTVNQETSLSEDDLPEFMNPFFEKNLKK